MELDILRNKIIVDETDSVWCDIFGIPVFVRGSDGQIDRYGRWQRQTARPCLRISVLGVDLGVLSWKI